MTTTTPEGSGLVPRDETGDAVEVVRSEEQLRVRTRTEVIGRVLVRKQVTSQEVTQRVTLRREELSVEELPAGDAEAGGRSLGEGDGEEIEIVLHEERVVVTTVPVERVRVRVHRVSEDVTVSEVLRRERIAFDVAPAVAPETTS